MKRVPVAILGMLFLGLLVAPAGAHAGAADGQTEIRGLVKRFFDAYARKDFDGFMSLWTEKSPELAVRKTTMRRIFSETGPIELKSLEVLQVALAGDAGKVHLHVELAGYDPKTGKLHPLLGKLDRFLELVREKNEWKVRRYMPPETELADRLGAAKSDEQKQQLLAEADKLDRGQVVLALVGLTSEAYRGGRQAEALRLNELALALAPWVSDQTIVARCHMSRALVQKAQSKNAEALSSAEKALALSREARSGEWEALALGILGDIQQSMDRPDEALKSHEASVKLARTLGKRDLLAAGLHSIGLIWRDRGKLAEAADNFESSAKAGREAGKPDLEWEALYDLGMVQGRQRKYAEALANLQAGVQVARTQGDRRSEAKAQTAMAFAHEGMKNFAEAVQADKTGLKIYRELGDKKNQAEVLSHLGLMYRKMGRYADALEASEASEKLKQELDDQSKAAPR